MYQEKLGRTTMTNNKIIAITVTKNYHKQLEILLQENTPLVDMFIIVSQEDDVETNTVINEYNSNKVNHLYYPLVPNASLPGHEKCPFISGDEELILQPNAHLRYVRGKPMFDKGGAQRFAQLQLQDEEAIILMIDSDIVLEEDLIEYIRKTEFKQDILYGVNRRDFICYSDFKQRQNHIPYYRTDQLDGYFHMYKHYTGQPRLFRRSFSAGYPDTAFKQLWCRRDEHPDQCTATNDPGLEILPEEYVVNHLGHDQRPITRLLRTRWTGMTNGNFIFE